MSCKRARIAALLARLGERGDIRDQVVDEHAEGREPDRARAGPRSGPGRRRRRRARPRRDGVPGTGDARRPASRGRSPCAGHGQRGAADPGDQREQRAERRRGRADAYQRRRPAPPGGAGRRRPAERPLAARPVRAEDQQHADRHGGVDDDRDGQGADDRAGDGARPGRAPPRPWWRCARTRRRRRTAGRPTAGCRTSRRPSGRSSGRPPARRAGEPGRRRPAPARRARWRRGRGSPARSGSRRGS